MNIKSKIIVIIIFLVLSLGIFSFIMNENLFIDENMYVTAGVLIQEYSLYSEFSYLQMPYLPIMYGMIFKLTGTDKYLLTARIINVFFTLASAIFIFLIAYKVCGDLFISICTLLLFVFNETLIWTMGFAWNAVMPITFTLMAIYVYITSVKEERVSILGVMASGMLVALATGTKLYYGVVFIPFLIVALLFPSSFSRNRRLKIVFFPMIIGYLFGSIPVLYYMIQDFELFWFNNIGFHFLDEYDVTGIDSMNIQQKLQAGLKYLGKQTTISVFIAVITIGLLVISTLKKGNNNLLEYFGKKCVLVILLVIFTIPVAFIGSPVWEHYFALPLPFVILIIPSFFNILSANQRETVQLLFICLMIVVMLYGGPQLYGSVNRIATVNSWEPIRFHRDSKELREYIGELRDDEKVLSLYSLYAVEAGLPVYREFSSGVFLYPVGDLLNADQRKRINTPSPGTLIDFLEENPPKVLLLVMLQPQFDKPFYKFVEDNDYREMERHFFGHTIFIKK